MGKHITMPCGWGCGAQLTARSVREHFTNCPMRSTAETAAIIREFPPLMLKAVMGANTIRYVPVEE